MHACVSALGLLITSMMWCDMDTYNWFNKFYNFYMAAIVGVASLVHSYVDVALEFKHIIETNLT